MRLFSVAGHEHLHTLSEQQSPCRYLPAVSHAHRSPQCKLITIIKRIICMFNNVLNIRHSTTEFLTRRWATFENIVNLTTVNLMRIWIFYPRATLWLWICPEIFFMVNCEAESSHSWKCKCALCRRRVLLTIYVISKHWPLAGCPWPGGNMVEMYYTTPCRLSLVLDAYRRKIWWSKILDKIWLKPQ